MRLVAILYLFRIMLCIRITYFSPTDQVPCCINRYGYQEAIAMAKVPSRSELEEPLVIIRLYDNHSYLPFLETVNHTVAAANRPKQLRFMQWYAAVVCGMLVMHNVIRARMRG